MGRKIPNTCVFCGRVSKLVHTWGPVTQLRVTASCLLMQTDCELETGRLREPQSAEESSENATTALCCCAAARASVCTFLRASWNFCLRHVWVNQKRGETVTGMYRLLPPRERRGKRLDSLAPLVEKTKHFAVVYTRSL